MAEAMGGMTFPQLVRTRRGAFGLFIAEVQCPSIRHVHLPIERPAQPTNLEDMLIAQGMPPALASMLVAPALELRPLPVDEAALAPGELRAQLEREARRGQQPSGWGDRTYQSVTGLRWRCCGNAFEDEHSPWCPAGGSVDPFPG